MRKPVSFYSEGVKLDGDLFLPDGLSAHMKPLIEWHFAGKG